MALACCKLVQTPAAIAAAAQLPTSFFGRALPLRVSDGRCKLSTLSSSHPLKVTGRGANVDVKRTTLDQRAEETPLISLEQFPDDFMFGSGSSAFQIEGAPTAGGRGSTIWDSWIHIPGNVIDGSVNYPGPDFYHLYEEDIERAKELGLRAFRFSISWTRIYPNGVGEASAEGIQYYNNVINSIVKAGLIPFCTLFHWEVPQYLENDPEVLGFRTKNIVPYFVKLAETCFKHFGDRVKIWATFNEMWTFCVRGYGYGNMAPGRCSPIFGSDHVCDAGDSTIEPYLTGHHMLIAHAKVYQLYKEKYKPHQQGVCGFNPCHFGAAPYSDSEEDKLATQRYLEFFSGWQIDPVVFGDYPKSMREAAGDRLPKFTEEESEELKNSCDFLGHNVYSAFFIKHADVPTNPLLTWWETDQGAATSITNAQGELIGIPTGPPDSWVLNCAPQIPPLLKWLQDRYGEIPCYITENGSMDPAPENQLEALDDQERITYIRDHLIHCAKAITDMGINLKGYFYWSMVDVFEWDGGYSCRFGLIRVEFEDGKPPTRTLKASAKWIKKLLTGN